MTVRNDDFDTILRLGGKWALGSWEEVDIDTGYWDYTWIAIHLHGRDYGYWLKRGSKCSKCGIPFPPKVIGMLNMMRSMV